MYIPNHFKLKPIKIEAKAKLSQNKSKNEISNIINNLPDNNALANFMKGISFNKN